MSSTMHEWLEALASDAPAPGGGAAAAVLVSTGAALVEMACSLTIGREKFRDVEPLMIETRGAVRDLRERSDRLRDDDTRAFEQVSAAYALSRASADEKRLRSERIQTALRGATEVPLETTAVGTAVLELAKAIAAVANPNVISDVGAAALAARAGAEASALNVKINLAAIKDEAYRTERGAALAGLLARATSACDDVLTLVHAAIER